MSSNDIIVSLDIGTYKVRVIIGEVSNGTINIIGVGTAESEGIRKGAIVDIDQTVRSIRSAIEHAERMVGIQIKDVYVGIQGNHVGLQTNRGVIAVSNANREISEEDISRVLEAAKVIALPPEREIIDLVPQQYLVDGLDGISDPMGMIGVRLEVEATVITSSKTAVHNIVRCIEKAGLHISGLILMSIASGEMSLTKDERLQGSVLIDIGAGSSTISIFDQGNLLATSTLPIGGEYVTSDISYGLRTQTDHAEKIKCKYGCALISSAASDLKFRVVRMSSNAEKEFTQVDLAQIIEPRMQEILHLIRMEVSRLGFDNKIHGYVLTGGAVSLPGTVALAQSEFQAPVRVAIPDYIGVRDPSYASGVGIIQYVAKNLKRKEDLPSNKKQPSRPNRPSQNKSSVMDRLKNILGEFI